MVVELAIGMGLGALAARLLSSTGPVETAFHGDWGTIEITSLVTSNGPSTRFDARGSRGEILSEMSKAAAAAHAETVKLAIVQIQAIAQLQMARLAATGRDTAKIKALLSGESDDIDVDALDEGAIKQLALEATRHQVERRRRNRDAEELERFAETLEEP